MAKNRLYSLEIYQALLVLTHAANYLQLELLLQLLE